MTATSILGFGLTVALAIGGCTGDGEGTTTDVASTTTTVSPTTTVDPLAAEEAAVSEAAEQARLTPQHAHYQTSTIQQRSAALDQFYVAGSEARADGRSVACRTSRRGLASATPPDSSESR